MRLPDAEWRNWPGMDTLLAALDAGDGKVRYVGGAVRDSLLGIDVQDVDCATVFPPNEVMRRIEAAGIKAVPTGIKHGTITAVLPEKHVIEVTTLRRDVSTDGRHATVEYSEDWEEDAARRDFTINALSADPLSGEIFDYFGGETDLDARRVRFIGLPAERIAEDHLRILRFFRFHARFGEGLPNPAGLAAAEKHANSLMALSRERIADEVLKTLALPNPADTVALMIEHGIFAPILPEIVSANALARLIGREERFDQPSDPVRRLAALLPPEPDTARAVATRLKLSRAQRTRLATATARIPGDTAEPRALAYRHGMEGAIDRLLLCPTNDIVTGNGLAHLIANPPPRFPLKGGELIAMGMETGPEVAAKLREIEEAWIAEDFPNEARVKQIAAALLE
ncbi:CCA tRNA nucleotidyltransferase [Parasphingopyxis lamellibrachiae]|uniref:Poly(A) polymerase n=1 Tax=Parasphingopyxis lamellibrachiae TaxID=680125 RepID=A0A3D9FED3_9SPHN|nr:CCA tRNA nucleotidyltransferase [Parasphingopyxis lamellibrachiae]RED16149.1 poly(A) polymerase [Parasphingopyxis lamellibrachiae]